MDYREKFEKWAKSKELDLDLNIKNEYSDIETAMFWECWQAALNSQTYDVKVEVYISDGIVDVNPKILSEIVRGVLLRNMG